MPQVAAVAGRGGTPHSGQVASAGLATALTVQLY
jgi:hypothetical protein